MTGSAGKSEILDRLAGILTKSFEVDPAAIKLEAHLRDDLEMDSIDAIDLAASLTETEGIELSEDELKEIRVVRDVVELVHAKLQDS